MSIVLKRELSKVKKMIHPNSRKSKAIVKKSKKICNRWQAKRPGLIKQMVVMEKLNWLQENMNPDVCPYTPELLAELLETYLARHDEELTFIAKMNKVAGKKNLSYASRTGVLRMTKQREMEEYNSCGIEIPNLLIAAQCTMLRKWDGEERYLPNFVFRRFGKKHLQEALQRNAKVQKISGKPREQSAALPDSASTAAMDTE